MLSFSKLTSTGGEIGAWRVTAYPTKGDIDPSDGVITHEGRGLPRPSWSNGGTEAYGQAALGFAPPSWMVPPGPTKYDVLPPTVASRQ
jgi:hypothetical protein